MMEGSGAAPTARQVEMAGILEDEGTVEVGARSIIDNNGSFYGLIPQPYARLLDVTSPGEADIYINVDERLVIHRIPEADDGDE